MRLNWNLCTNFSVSSSVRCSHSKPRSGHIIIIFLFLVRSRNGRDFLSHSGRYYCQLGLIPHEKHLSDFSVVKLEARSSPFWKWNISLKLIQAYKPAPSICTICYDYLIYKCVQWLYPSAAFTDFIFWKEGESEGCRQKIYQLFDFTRSAWRIRWLHFVCSSGLSL